MNVGEYDNIRLRVGEATHFAWKKWRMSIGYPNHPFHSDLYKWGPGNGRRCVCGVSEMQHHDDMVDWAVLSVQKREKYILQGMAAYDLSQIDLEQARPDPRIGRVGWNATEAENRDLRAEVERLRGLFHGYRDSYFTVCKTVAQLGYTKQVIEAQSTENQMSDARFPLAPSCQDEAPRQHEPTTTLTDEESALLFTAYSSAASTPLEKLMGKLRPAWARFHGMY